MIPGTYNMVIPRGGTVADVITAEDPDNIGTNIDFESTYNSARLQIRPSWANNPKSKSRPLLLELSTANGGIILSNDLLTLNIPANVTSVLDFNSGIYELELVKDGDPEVVDKLLNGTCTVTGEVAI